MKNVSNFIRTVLLLCIANITLASGSTGFVTEVSSSNTFVLKLKNPGKAPVQVVLKDSDGRTLYEEDGVESGINQMYNLKNLPLGTYVLIVTNDDRIAMQPITKGKNLLLIDTAKLQTILPPSIDHNSGYLDIKMVCPGNLSMHLKVEDNDGHVLYIQKIKSTGEFQKRLNLEQLENGHYHCSVAISGAVLNHSFTEHIDLLSNK